jgi:hypothetical protein
MWKLKLVCAEAEPVVVIITFITGQNIVIGTMGETNRPSDIISMNGTSYSKSEITIKPVDVKRNEVFDKLGIYI